MELGGALEGTAPAAPAPALSWGFTLPAQPGQLRPSGASAHCASAASAHPRQARSPLPSHGTRAHLAQDLAPWPGSLLSSGAGGHVGGPVPTACMFLGSTARPLLSPPWPFPARVKCPSGVGQTPPQRHQAPVAPGGLPLWRWHPCGESSWRCLSACPCPSRVLFFDLSFPCCPRLASSLCPVCPSCGWVGAGGCACDPLT